MTLSRSSCSMSSAAGKDGSGDCNARTVVAGLVLGGEGGTASIVSSSSESMIMTDALSGIVRTGLGRLVAASSRGKRPMRNSRA